MLAWRIVECWWRCQPSPLNGVLNISTGNKWSSQPLRLWPEKTRPTVSTANVTSVRHAGGMTPPKTPVALIGHSRTKGIRQEKLTSGVLFRRHLWTHLSKHLNFLFCADAVTVPPSRQTVACQAMEITCEHRRHRFSPAKSVSQTWHDVALWDHMALQLVPLPKGFFFRTKRYASKSYTVGFANRINVTSLPQTRFSTWALRTVLLFVRLITEPHTRRHTVLLPAFRLPLVSWEHWPKCWNTRY